MQRFRQYPATPMSLPYNPPASYERSRLQFDTLIAIRPLTMKV